MLGLASVTRSAMLACVPALALYLVVGGVERGGSAVGGRLARQFTGFAAGFLVPAVALAAYNLLRFGSALDTGNGFVNGLAAMRTIFGGNVLVGLYGLLLSPGKSILLYAPPIAAAAVAAWTLWRSARSEVVLVAGLTLSQLALVAPLVFWHGDSAWGPRYLVPLVPLLLLPLVAWLRPEYALGRVRTLALAMLTTLGVIVQVLGVTANPHTYILVTDGPDGTGRGRAVVCSARVPGDRRSTAIAGPTGRVHTSAASQLTGARGWLVPKRKRERNAAPLEQR